MKIKKALAMLSLLSICVLASCGGTSQSASQTDTQTTPTTQGPTNMVEVGSSTSEAASNSQQTEASYEAITVPTIESDSTPSAKTEVEAAVEEVYDSVVSIVAGNSAGSGVLFAQDQTLGISYVVTCFHVIDSAKTFNVTLNNNETYEAKLVGGYSDLDLAVLSIKATNLTYAKFFDDSDKIKIGSTVICIGNPKSLQGSVSSGIVSYNNRVVQADTYTYRTLIQTDVAINSGNSGGALFNSSGNLIGIVNAKYSSTGIEGLGFAIPINDVRNTINSILSTAKYDKENNSWYTGYVEGDYEIGFTLNTYQYGSFYQSSYYVYVSAIDSNTTTSYGALSAATQLNDSTIVTGIKIDYQDEEKTDKEITSLSTSTEANNLIYKSTDLSLGDKIILTFKNGSKVEIELVQYRYYI